MKSVSVIIPVWNHDEALVKCLRSLEAQTYPPSLVQVLVVDNGVVPTLRKGLGSRRVTVVHEPRPGSYAARNKGIEAATGDCVGFIDADCVAAPNWIESAVKSLESKDAIAGEVVVTAASHVPSAFELYDQLTGITQRYFVEEEGFGATANLWTKRSVLRSVGPFLDLFSGGDLEWGNRLLRTGGELRFAEEVVVFHPARSSWAELVLRARRTHTGRRELHRQNRLRLPFGHRWNRAKHVLNGVRALRGREGWGKVIQVGALGLGLRLLERTPVYRRV